MRAVVLAAGSGSRMEAVSGGRPKCLLPLHGRPLLDHQLDLLAAAGVQDVVVVTGFCAGAVREAAAGRARFRHYEGFAGRNNLPTLRAHRDLLDRDTLILFADVLVAAADLRRLVDADAELALLVSTGPPRPGTMTVRDATGSGGGGNFVGIARCSAAGANALRDQLAAMNDDGAYWTAALPPLIAAGHAVGTVPVEHEWLELDTPDDYAAARSKRFYLVPEAARCAG